MIEAMATDRLKRLRALCDSDPKNPFAWYTLAMELKKTDLAAALATFRSVHDEHPSYLPNYFHYAKALEAAQESSEAKRIYREGMAIARSKGDAHTHEELEAALDAISD